VRCAGLISMAKQIPASCAEVDLAAVEREVIRTGANVSATAKKMGVPVHDLRLLTHAIPRLIEAAWRRKSRRSTRRRKCCATA
jgi:hypothetical protein